MKPIFHRTLLAVLALNLLLAGSAWGQRLIVSVKDPSGAVISDATVVVRNSDLKLRKLLQTDARGETVLVVPPGRHAVIVNASGFSEKTTHVDVAAGRNSAVNVVLPVGRGSGVEVLCPDRPIPINVQKLRKTAIVIHVNDRTTAEPIAGAHISLSPAEAPCNWSMGGPTDEQGLLHISVPNGEYAMKVGAIGYSVTSTVVKVGRKEPEIKATLQEKLSAKR